MKSVVYVIARPGDPRRYAQTTEPAPDRVRALRAEGYSVIAVTFDMPSEFQTQDFDVEGETG